ncbi:MAG: hypothetical protein ABIV28_00015 [Longimicrobiales bacterium]
MAPKEDPVRKKFRLTQSKIDRAREILGTTTDTETIEKALELVALHGAKYANTVPDR